MSNVKRVYVEKKPEFANEARSLCAELRGLLGITALNFFLLSSFRDSSTRERIPQSSVSVLLKKMRLL